LNGLGRLLKAALFFVEKNKKRGSQRRKSDVYWSVVMENYGDNCEILGIEVFFFSNG